MKVFCISLENDSFLIEKTSLKVNKFSNVNTNAFVNNSLYYTLNYIRFNKKTISEFLNSKNCSSAVYKDFDSFLVLSSLIVSVNIKFDLDKSLSPKVMNMLIDNDYVKYLECYFMPSDFVHELAIKNVSIKFSNDMLFTSAFINDNDFRNLREIYYKKVICFNRKQDVFENLEFFLRVNNSLKLINLYCYSDDMISFVVDKLKKYSDDVDVFIHQTDDNIAFISAGTSHLRKLNKKYSKKNVREIKIIYSDSFVRENIFRELTLNGVKFASVFVLYVSVVLIFSNRYHEYMALLNLRILNSTLADTTIGDTSLDEIDDTEITEEVEPETPAPVDPEPERPKEYVNHYASIQAQTFDKLLAINSDVVGWLRVNNTKVNYPITKANDNHYYLEHDIYKRNIMTGWVFMDYRNNHEELNHNTVIYGHNLITGYMFGDLKNTTSKDWYLNPDNQIISFSTLNKEMKWKIISIYRTDYTTDYLKTSFYNDEQFMKFVDMIKGRSIYNFNVPVSASDKILTLSTCSGSNNRRLAIHAVLIS